MHIQFKVYRLEDVSGICFISLTNGKIKSPKSEESVRIRSVMMPPVVFFTQKT